MTTRGHDTLLNSHWRGHRYVKTRGRMDMSHGQRTNKLHRGTRGYQVEIRHHGDRNTNLANVICSSITSQGMQSTELIVGVYRLSHSGCKDGGWPSSCITEPSRHAVVFWLLFNFYIHCNLALTTRVLTENWENSERRPDSRDPGRVMHILKLKAQSDCHVFATSSYNTKQNHMDLRVIIKAKTGLQVIR